MNRRDFIKKLFQLPLLGAWWFIVKPNDTPSQLLGLRPMWDEGLTIGGWFHLMDEGWRFEPYQAPFDGHIAAVEFYPYALSDEEIEDLYLQTREQYGTT